MLLQKPNFIHSHQAKKCLTSILRILMFLVLSIGIFVQLQNNEGYHSTLVNLLLFHPLILSMLIYGVHFCWFSWWIVFSLQLWMILADVHGFTWWNQNLILISCLETSLIWFKLNFIPESKLYDLIMLYEFSMPRVFCFPRYYSS